MALTTPRHMNTNYSNPITKRKILKNTGEAHPIQRTNNRINKISHLKIVHYVDREMAQPLGTQTVLPEDLR